MKKAGILSLVLVFAVVFSASAFAFTATDTPYGDSLFYHRGAYDIHYRVCAAQGEQKGRIMMIHGFLCSTYAFEPMAERLSEAGYECVLADLPGFGYSTRVTAGMEQIDRETLVEGLMRSIAPMDEWIVAGHSMGGGVAMNIAVDFPDIRALLLFCPAPVSESASSLKKVMTSDFMGGALSFLFREGTKIKPLVRLILLAASLDWNFSMDYDADMLTAPLQLPGTGESLAQMMYGVRANDIDAVSKLEMPMLVVNAQYDLVLSSSMKKTMADALPSDAQTCTVGGGHMCVENRADELAGVALDFLAG